MVAHQEDGEWLSVAGAARKLGVSRQAIQKRIARGKIENRRDNMGNPQVWVAAPPATEVPGAPPRTLVAPVTPTVEAHSEPQPEGHQSLSGAADSVPVSVVNLLLVSHSEALERQERRHQADVVRQREDADQRLDRQSVAHQVEIARVRTDHARERRVDRFLTALVAVLALAVIARLGPVVVR